MPDVTILPDGVRVTAQDDETLLRALARAGLRYRVGCKRGGCGICKVTLQLGEVRYERPVADSVLTDDERVEGICLSCRAVPLTNIVIELQEGDRLRRVLGFAFPRPPSRPAPEPAADTEKPGAPGGSARPTPEAAASAGAPPGSARPTPEGAHGRGAQ